MCTIGIANAWGAAGDAGITQLQEALRLARELDDPEVAFRATLNLTTALALFGRRDEAIEAWRRAIGLDPMELNALFNITVNLAEAGRRDDARHYGERFIAAAPPAMQADVAAIQRLLAR